ncbi:hypothetical protein Cgig2_002587 [Carnegiea gigantea]|uniref:Uncharacterized protein n=1 Tax=Carnegiea gigantea TaxID=171969 RepID=A0A9Q1GT07_9CARY|nr:hypothetical protein Cgig2_002587 [Carnegiea gigantea]
MANTRGGQAPKRARQASKSKESGSSALAKRRSHRIAAGTSKRACKPVTQTTVIIPDSPSISDQSSDNSASTQSVVAPSLPAQHSSPAHEQSSSLASPSPPPPPPLPPHRCLDQFPEASSLELKHPDTASAPTIADTLAELKDDYAELRPHLEHIQTEMGLMNCKIDELIRLTSLIHHGTKLTIPFQSTDIEKATQAADRIILYTSSTPHFR